MQTSRDTLQSPGAPANPWHAQFALVADSVFRHVVLSRIQQLLPGPKTSGTLGPRPDLPRCRFTGPATLARQRAARDSPSYQITAQSSASAHDFDRAHTLHHVLSGNADRH